MDPAVSTAEVEQVLKESLDFIDAESRRLDEALALLTDAFSKKELEELRARLASR